MALLGIVGRSDVVQLVEETASLATMLSLSIIGQRGLRVSGLLYLRIGLITVPLLLISSVFGLWLALRLS